MRFLEGLSLQAVLAREKLPRLDRTLKILDQLAGALDYLQEQRLVHRDIKPANIMIGGRDQATLMDFGLARVISGSHLSLSGALAFTPLYASPEQAAGERLTPASDRYSLAVIAYEMLAGLAPHAKFDPQMLLHAIRYDEPPLADEVNHALPPAVSRVLQTALSKRPEDRPPNAEVFVQEFRTALGSRLAYLMRDLRSALEPRVANLFKPEAPAPVADDKSGQPDGEMGQGGPEGTEPSLLETLPMLPAKGAPQGWSRPKPRQRSEEDQSPESKGASPALAPKALPARIPDELEKLRAAGVKQVAVIGRNADVCPACASVRAQIHPLQKAPALPLRECTSKWGCHCEYVPVNDESHKLPENILAMLDAVQRSYFDLLRLRAPCARGEAQQIRIEVEPAACSVCKEAAHGYDPKDIPLLPLADCRRYPPCQSRYRLIPKELTQFAAAGAKRVAVFGRNSDTCAACAAVRAQRFPMDNAPELPVKWCSSASGCHCAYVPFVEDGEGWPDRLFAMLDVEQRQFLNRLWLLRACAQGEATQIKILALPDACPACQTAARAYDPADVPLLPLAGCTCPSLCNCQYQLVRPPPSKHEFLSPGGALRRFLSMLNRIGC